MDTQRIITREMVTAASMLVRMAHADDNSLARALERAQERLFAQPWVVVAGILQIASHSHPTDVHSTDGTDCTCPTTRGTCYHVASWMVLSTIAATGVHPIAPLPLPAIVDDDALPAESFLDGDFDAFEDTSLLGHDEYGDVLPVPAARVYFEEVDSLPVSFRPGLSIELVPEPGSAFAKAQADADALFAA